jgi:hypothetical protein
VTIWLDALILISSYNNDDDNNNMMWIKHADTPICYIIFCPYFAIFTSLICVWYVSRICVIIVILYMCVYILRYNLQLQKTGVVYFTLQQSKFMQQGASVPTN